MPALLQSKFFTFETLKLQTLNLILCIETSTTACSVALCDEQGIVASKEENSGYTHAENLYVFIEEVIQKSGRSKKDLAAIAVSALGCGRFHAASR